LAVKLPGVRRSNPRDAVWEGALRGKSRPSPVLFTEAHDRRPDRQAVLLLVSLPGIEEPLQSGCVVLFDDARLRIRRLAPNPLC
jgi:hypothetical protein